MSTEPGDLRERAPSTMRSFERMQNVKYLKQKLSGGWLVATAIILAVGYLPQPLIVQLFAWRAGAE